MKVKIYSSGFGHVDDYVWPFVDSIDQFEPGADLTIVDNGSPEAYPQDFRGWPVYRTENLAIMTSFNRAIAESCWDWDWLMLTDTDVLCQGEFLHRFERFDPECIYGQQRFERDGARWFDGWLFCVSRQVWDALGPFDERYLLTGAFQDMDYCLRARSFGFGLELAELPFLHKEANTTHKSPSFWENRAYNAGLIRERWGVRL